MAMVTQLRLDRAGKYLKMVQNPAHKASIDWRWGAVVEEVPACGVEGVFGGAG